MAILYYTGWEAGSVAWYNAQDVALWTGSPAINTLAANCHQSLSGQGSQYSLAMPASTWRCANNTVVAGTARFLHFWWKPGVALFVSFMRSGTSQCSVYITGDGAAILYRGPQTTVLDTFLGVCTLGVPHWIAIEAVADDAAGLIKLWIDDVLVASVTGDTKAHATLTGWDAWFWGWEPSNGGIFNTGGYIDDVVVTDNTTGRLTEKQVFRIAADGDSAPLTLTTSTGTSHFALIDEFPLNDADFNNTAVSGNEDFYTWTTPPTTNSIAAVQFSARVTKDAALTLGQISVKSNVTTVYQPAVTLPTSPTFRGISYMLETDPDTGVAWTDGGVAAVLAGIKFTT